MCTPILHEYVYIQVYTCEIDVHVYLGVDV